MSDFELISLKQFQTTKQLSIDLSIRKFHSVWRHQQRQQQQLGLIQIYSNLSMCACVSQHRCSSPPLTIFGPNYHIERI